MEPEADARSRKLSKKRTVPSPGPRQCIRWTRPGPWEYESQSRLPKRPQNRPTRSRDPAPLACCLGRIQREGFPLRQFRVKPDRLPGRRDSIRSNVGASHGCPRQSHERPFHKRIDRTFLARDFDTIEMADWHVRDNLMASGVPHMGAQDSTEGHGIMPKLPMENEPDSRYRPDPTRAGRRRGLPSRRIAPARFALVCAVRECPEDYSPVSMTTFP